MPLRIAFDLDGVLADMESEVVRQAGALFGEPMTRRMQERAAETEQGATPPETPPVATPDSEAAADRSAENVPPLSRLNMTRRQRRRLWNHVKTVENFWHGLHELEPGIIARLSAIAIDRRWEVIFLTKRPETAGATAQMQSQWWLESKGFALPSVYVVQGSRGRIAESLGLDLLVDDRAENCLDVVVDSKARAILVWRDDEKRLPAAARRLGIGVVKTVAECLDLLAHVDSKPREQPGVCNRVMRLLGLKEPANV